MLRWSTQVRPRQDMGCQDCVSQSEDRLRQTDQWEARIHCSALESRMMYSDSVTVPGAGPNKWGPLEQHLHTDNMRTHRGSLTQSHTCSYLARSPGMVLFLCPGLTSGWGCCDGLMTRKNQQLTFCPRFLWDVIDPKLSIIGPGSSQMRCHHDPGQEDHQDQF